jgi:AraC-like DNA-binding protein
MNIWNILVLLGAIQGLILGLILLFSKNKPKAQTWLGFFILTLAYTGFETYAWTQSGLPNAPFHNLLRFMPLYISATCLYLYVRVSLFPENPLRSLWQYFLPALIDIALRLFVLSTPYFLSEQKSQFLDAKHLWVSKFAATPILIYSFFLAVKLYFEFVENKYNSVDNQQVTTKIWIRNFLICLTPIVSIWSFTIWSADYLQQDSNIFFFYPIAILLAFLIYFVAFTGAHRIKIVEIETQRDTQAFFNSIEKIDIENTLHALTQTMEQEKLYLNADLSLTILANHININPKIISSVLNQALNQGFNEYVNTYRILEVKNQLLNNAQKRTIAEIAFASGFNSIPTFQRVFKAQTTVSPKEFLTTFKENDLKNGFE